MAPTIPTTSAAKICIRCGVDCSTRPRTKDLQGRYTCRDCYDALQRRESPAAPVVTIVAADPGALAAAPAGAAGGEEGSEVVGEEVDGGEAPALLDALLADAVQQQAAAPASSPCPGCGHPFAADAAICTTCGYNPRTGAAIQTRKVEVEAPAPGPLSERARAREFEAAEARRLERMEYLKPLVVIALAIPGVCFFLTVNKNMTGLTVSKYLAVYLLSIVITAAVYALYCLVRLGFRDPLALGALRLAAVVAACDLVRIPLILFGGFDAFSQGFIGLVIPFGMCIGLLYYFLDLDILDAILLGVAMTATLFGAGFVITAAMGA